MQLVRATVALVVIACAAPLLGQVPEVSYSGRTITDVQVLIERRPSTEPALLELIQTRRGEMLSLAEVRESITHLHSLGRFQDVQVEATEAPGGVALSYSLVPLHLVERVEFKGTLGLSSGDLRRAMTERFGATPPVGRGADVARVLEQLYADHGYFGTSIRPTAEEFHNPDRTILTFNIDAGPRAQIGRVVLSGNPRAPHTTVLAKLDVTEGRPYERVALQRRLTDFVEDLKKRRYYQALASHTAQLSEDKQRADLAVDIQSGPVVTLTFQGDTLPADRIKELVPIEREGSVDEDLREDSAQRIRDYLHSLGHWKADVTIQDRRATEDQLEIQITIRKGPVYRVAEIDISGTSAIPLTEIRPLVPLETGDVFVAGRLDAGVTAIRQYAPYARVRVG